MAEKMLNLLEDIQKGISPSYLGNFNKIINADLDTVKGGMTSNFRLRIDFPSDTVDVLTAKTFTAAVTDICTATNIQSDWKAGMSVTLTTTGTLPAGLSTSTIYYIFWNTGMTGNQFKLADSLANLKSKTAVDITDTGTGTHTITPNILGNANGVLKNIVSYDNYLFAVDYAGQIWANLTGYGETWLKIKGSSTVFNNIVIWKNYLVALSSTNTIEIFGSLKDMDTADWKTWDTAPTFSTGGGRYPNCVMTNGFLYIGDDNWVASLNEVSGTVFDPTDGTTYNWNNQALNFTSDSNITALEQYGLNLMIGVTNLTSKKASLYAWDTIQSSFFDGITVSGYSIYPMKSFNGLLYFMTVDSAGFSTGKLYATNGSSTKEVASLQASGEVQLTNPPFKVYRFGMKINNDKLYIGVGYQYRAGLYSYNPNTGAVLCEYLAQTQLTTNVNYEAFEFNGNDLIVGIYDDSYDYPYTNTIQRLYTSGTYKKATSYFETGFYQIGTKRRPKTLQFFEVTLGKKLVTGESVTLYFRNNNTDTYTLIGTMSYTLDGAIYSKVIDNAIVQGDQVQFKVVIDQASHAVVSPEIKSIYVY